MPETCLPVSLISVSHILALTLRLKPYMYTPSFLLIVFPVAHVLLPNIGPIHCTHSALDITPPLSFKIVSRWIIVHFSIAMLHIVFEITFKDTSTLENNLSFSLFFAIDPVTLIGRLIDSILTKTMSEPIFDVAFITTSVWPFIGTFSCDAIIIKLSNVNNAISPCKFALSTEKSIIKVALIGITIFEGDFCGAIQAFTIDFAILR